jgi:hypothetical protein
MIMIINPKYNNIIIIIYNKEFTKKYTTEITRYTTRAAHLTHWAQVTDEWLRSFVWLSEWSWAGTVVYLVIYILLLILLFLQYVLYNRQIIYYVNVSLNPSSDSSHLYCLGQLSRRVCRCRSSPSWGRSDLLLSVLYAVYVSTGYYYVCVNYLKTKNIKITLLPK